jgi:hypothetical protein
MNLWEACRDAFGQQAVTLDFKRRMSELLRLEKIDPSRASAKPLRYNCVSVAGDNPPKTVHIGQTGIVLQVVGRPQPAAQPAPPSVDHGANAF